MNIKGTITHIVFRNELNGYTVGTIKLKEKSDKINTTTITFVGTFGKINIKDNYELTGKLIKHDKYGLQFAVDTYCFITPSKEDDLVSFLSSSLFPMGEATAKKIVKKYGKDTLSKIEESSDNLVCIPRITKVKADKIRNIIIDYKSSNEMVLDITKMGFKTKDAINITYKYGNNSIEYLHTNIYNLIDDMKYNFKDIDIIAINNGIDKYDDRRIEALIIYIIKELCFESGDTYLYISDIYNGLLKYINDLNIDILEYNLINLEKLSKIYIDKDRIYLKTNYDNEVVIASRITSLLKNNNQEIKDIEKEITTLEENDNITYDESQIKAISMALKSNISVITGGPGSGKTTIVKAIVKLLSLKVKKEEIVLLAPTGKASKRLMEMSGVSAYTIHKFLEWDKEKDEFNVNIYNKKKVKYIIIDEISMVDTTLLASLFKGTYNNTKYIMVGDYNQLPSISGGQVLKDIIDSKLIPVIKLNKLYRQNDNSYIPLLAKEIKEKQIQTLEKKDDYNFIKCPNNYIYDIIIEILNKALNKGYDVNDIQILAPMYKTMNGIDNLNRACQNIFNPPKKGRREINIGSILYREGDKVLQLVNDADNNVYNGDIGFICEINNKEGKGKSSITIDFDGNYVVYTSDKFINFTHGYAISVHKSQGGEYKMVIMPCSQEFKRMLYNKLIYTAVTRAKSSLIIVGDFDAFCYGCLNEDKERKTGLKDLLLMHKKNK